jgi:hypothetical protein
MANTFVGVGILFGFPGGPAGTLTGVGSLTQIQSLDFARKAQKEQTKDGNGNTAGVSYSDHEDSATIDFVFSSGTATGAATVTDVPSPGALVTLTDSNFTPLTKTLLCDEFSASRGNTKAMMAKITLSRYINNSLPS